MEPQPQPQPQAVERNSDYDPEFNPDPRRRLWPARTLYPLHKPFNPQDTRLPTMEPDFDSFEPPNLFYPASRASRSHELVPNAKSLLERSPLRPTWS
ncbi:hypothetical protein VTK56DRAFT_8313 [Thermocarpiscus australiensis]